MPEEISSLLAAMERSSVRTCGQRTYHEGLLWDRPVVMVFSGWGKVAAASTATELIARFNVDQIVFTGVAGGVAPEISIGDVVIGTSLVQHDMDARPLFPRHVIPLLGLDRIHADPKLAEKLFKAASGFVADICEETAASDRKRFGIQSSKVIRGEIASGDKFFADHADLAALRSRLEETVCVEMEGAAVAQVCHEHKVPFGIVRTISDSAGASAATDFPAFVQTIATRYAHGILRRLLTTST